MRILFASMQGAGHFGPLIPFIDACVRNEHEILIVGPPQGIELVLGNGKYRATARRIADEMRALPPVDEFLASSYDRASPKPA